MKLIEYQAYRDRVAKFLTDNRVKPGCHDADPYGLSHFSGRACECCGSKLGGYRQKWAFSVENTRQELDEPCPTFEAYICVDCVYYLTHGQLDDATMMEIEADAKGGGK